MFFYALVDQIFAHLIIPHVTSVNRTELRIRTSLVGVVLSLHTSCQINVEAKVHAVSNILGNFFDDWFDLIDLFFSHSRIERNELNQVQFENYSRQLMLIKRLNSENFCSFSDNDEMLGILNRQYTKQAVNGSLIYDLCRGYELDFYFD